MQRSALFVADDRPEAGNGHKVRCGALANELRSRGWSCLFLERGEHDEGSDVMVIDLSADLPRQVVLPGKAKTVRIVDAPDRYCHGWDMLVCGSAGERRMDFSTDSDLLAGPQFALLRPEFREMRDVNWERRGIFDARDIAGMSAHGMSVAMRSAGAVITYGGMRALECACVGTPMFLNARNEGEAHNARGLMHHDPERLMRIVDGLGCKRVADAIEGMFP
jgi:spore coat polysaccharide biosynthesis predicted glycosyltransferase SpsG